MILIMYFSSANNSSITVHACVCVCVTNTRRGEWPSSNCHVSILIPVCWCECSYHIFIQLKLHASHHIHYQGIHFLCRFRGEICRMEWNMVKCVFALLLAAECITFPYKYNIWFHMEWAHVNLFFINSCDVSDSVCGFVIKVQAAHWFLHIRPWHKLFTFVLCVFCFRGFASLNTYSKEWNEFHGCHVMFYLIFQVTKWSSL